jgi:dihydropteroate synthase
MHNRPAGGYQHFWNDLLFDLQLSLALAAAAGIPARQIWLDPGFGFAKDVAQNLAVVRNLGRVVALGHPVLLGTSRKSTIGRVLDAEPGDRLDGTGATIVWGIQQGCQMVRVHDVAAMRRYVLMADALKQGLEYSL